MIRSLVTALFWLSFSVPVAAQPRPPKPIELTAEIISQSYCAVNPDASSLEIKLKLRYRNVGKQRVILYNGHDLSYQTKIRSAPGNAAGPYEVWVVNSRYFDEEVESIDQTSPGKVFVTLAPGAIHSREIVIGVGLVSENKRKGCCGPIRWIRGQSTFSSSGRLRWHSANDRHNANDWKSIRRFTLPH